MQNAHETEESRLNVKRAFCMCTLYSLIWASCFRTFGSFNMAIFDFLACDTFDLAWTLFLSGFATENRDENCSGNCRLAFRGFMSFTS